MARKCTSGYVTSGVSFFETSSSPTKQSFRSTVSFATTTPTEEPNPNGADINVYLYNKKKGVGR